MRRILFTILWCMVSFAVLLCGSRPIMAKGTKAAIDKNQLYAQSAVLMDAASGRVLFEKEGETVRPMASTTKIMTCILTLENGNLDDEVEVSDYAASMPDVQLHIRKGEHYRLKDLLCSLMLESHNDSAVAIAEHIGGSVEGFAQMMNDKAREIGCTDTYFITPNGLDAQEDIMTEDGGVKTVMHSTTARDLALIMSYCIKQSPQKESFLEITRTPSHSFSNIEGKRSFSCNNHNAFLQMMDGALSGKTGFTGKAGYCYVGALEREGKTFVVALLACGWPNNKSYKWSDTKKLMSYGLEHYEQRDVSQEELPKEWFLDIPVEDAQTASLYGKKEVGVFVKDDGNAPALLMKPEEKVKVSCSIKKCLKAPVEKGQAVGTLQYQVDGEVVWKREICAKEEVRKVDYEWFLKRVGDAFFAL
ncbi:D-alanyl-D-alanine carboxypeptidase [Lachnospiraceae bacterium]|nr:D-alanyl-D-alanine carboxypeptidase [Lachnospiraceae bacterium]